ncbi:replication protein [Erwinia aphidicola]
MSIAQVIKFPKKTEQSGGHMADLSNGYTKVANEIQQLKPRLKMAGRDWQVFEAIIWLTYGWNKKQDRVTNTVIAELTDLSDKHVCDAIKALAERQIIFSRKQGSMKLVGVNTELSAWILERPKSGTKYPESGITFPKSGKPSPETVTTQYKNKNSNKTPLNPPEGKEKSFDPLEVPTPEWLDSNAWREWVQYRAQAKKPIKTVMTITKAFNLLKECFDEGHNPAEVINTSIANGYQGLFKPKYPARKSPTPKTPRTGTALKAGRISYEHATGRRD